MKVALRLTDNFVAVTVLVSEYIESLEIKP